MTLSIHSRHRRTLSRATVDDLPRYLTCRTAAAAAAIAVAATATFAYCQLQRGRHLNILEA